MNPVEVEQFLNSREPDASALGAGVAPFADVYFDGDKFPGGFGPTKLFTADYWTLRQRSTQLFNENLYAKGLIRRLITNEINTGLTPEACPDESVLGLQEDALADWTEDVETRHAIWARTPELCDWKHENTFGALQRIARREALIDGDVLVVLRQSNKTLLPQVQLISGSKVRNPISENVKIAKTHKVTHGVEQDAEGRVVAYWVKQADGSVKRLAARSPRTGRRIAWLQFGTEKRLDDVRGQPLLAIVLQSLKEIDRYRDSAQRKAVVNSILAMFIKKTEDKPGTRPITNGATRRGQATVRDTDGTARRFNLAEQIPGVIAEELQQGEEPILKGGEGTDVNFGTFEEAIIQAVAWANEIPPEILRLAFSNNYSASQAAINEFKIYLNKVWSEWGETFCQPIFIDWLLSEVLKGRIKADGLLDAWRDPTSDDIFGAWVAAEWYGSIKPSTDMLKQGKGSKLAVSEGWSTNAREARGLTGTKFSKNIKRLKRENELKVEALRPLAAFEAEFGTSVDAVAQAALSAEDRSNDDEL